MKTPCFAFFDVDDTLISTKSMFSFFGYWASEILQDPLVLNRFDDDFREMRAAGKLREELNRAYYRFFAGIEPAKLAEAGRAWAEKQIGGADAFFHEGAVECLRRHLADGVVPVFVSGSFGAVLGCIAERLDVRHILATRMEIGPDGLYTGEIGHPQTIGRGKAEAVSAFLVAQGGTAATCFAYGDDLSDLPMLEAVGHPRAVGEGTPLATLAGERGWPVVPLHGNPLRAAIPFPAH